MSHYPPTPWLLGSNNRGKVKEMSAILHQFGVEIQALSDRNIHTEVDEWGTSFVQNAALEALGYGSIGNEICIADDSGIAVEALQGAPGVHSARYAGPHATDDDNNKKLQQELHNVPMGNRACTYHCIIAVAAPTSSQDPRIARLTHNRPPMPYMGFDMLSEGAWLVDKEALESWMPSTHDWYLWLFQGLWHGTVATHARGEGGFGYDPWVMLPDGRHVAELPDSEKNSLSHRARALTELQDALL